MIFKILCGIIVICGCGYGGFLYSEKLKTRVYTLEELCDGLSLLEFNVRYMSYPLCRAFECSAHNRNSAVGEVFKRSALLMKNDMGITAGEAFLCAVNENFKDLNISKDEAEILKSFAKTLGQNDAEGEISNIKTAKLRLSSALEDARTEIFKKVKMSRSIGVLLGLFIVIVLI